MGSKRVFIGRLPRGCAEHDVKDFFRRCGRIREVIMKRGYAFVDFRDDRDASDAVYDMNGKSMKGERMTVEIASGRPRGGSGGGGDRGGRGRDYGRGSDRGRNDRPPARTDYQISLENLSSRVSWKELKDIFSKEDLDVVYADAHKIQRHQGIVEFKTEKDLRRAVKLFDGKEVQGRVLEVKITKEGGQSPDRSSRRKRRHSDSYSGDERSPRRTRDSRSRSPMEKKPAADKYDSEDSRGRSPSPLKRNRSAERSVSRSRSPE